ncbi:e3 ubiquitin-protein ligase FANCL [Nephila pilipes]|uniref:E3 ubiquitin-protein ligase FANCL n=1 Tax=Nephila pilipes TaxID=299642 RepID=A0A8X6NP05_NEPPI|nr:e3 ubiquitin-protein ligase FANCL [Nephila pilipes]
MDNFDQVMPLNYFGNEVAGFICAMNEEFYIHLIVQDNTYPRKVRLRGCEKLHRVLKPVLHTLEKHLNQTNTIKDMLCEIQNALEQQIRLIGPNPLVDRCAEYNVIFEQLQACGWDKVDFISSDFHELHLKAVDESDREHILKVWIPDKFPNEGPKFECDLPQDFQYRWLPDDSLLNIFSVFQETLNMFAEFWNIMDELDKNTWILEPETSSRKDCKRRIALSPGVSLFLVVNPLMPTAVPTCHYLGPERVVEPVRAKFNKNIHKWNEFDSLLTNLQQVLELEFPSPATSVKEEFCIECGICYSYLLGEATPEMTCDSPDCNQSFHHACIYEYIRMLPDVRSSFNKLFGHCPYCNKPMWCTIL